jgi:hypothetical protein
MSERRETGVRWLDRCDQRKQLGHDRDGFL